MKSLSLAQSCPTLCDPMDCSLPGFSVHGIFKAKVQECGSIAFSTYPYMCMQFLMFQPVEAKTSYCHKRLEAISPPAKSLSPIIRVKLGKKHLKIN